MTAGNTQDFVAIVDDDDNVSLTAGDDDNDHTTAGYIQDSVSVTAGDTRKISYVYYKLSSSLHSFRLSTERFIFNSTSLTLH